MVLIMITQLCPIRKDGVVKENSKPEVGFAALTFLGQRWTVSEECKHYLNDCTKAEQSALKQVVLCEIGQISFPCVSFYELSM